MQALSTLKLAGDAGVNWDLEPCDLEPDYFTSGANFILRNGKIETCNGSKVIYSPGGLSALKLSKIVYVQADIDRFYLAMGLKAVYCFNGTAWSDIGSGTYSLMNAGDEFFWTYCKLGLIPIINNPQGYPQYWSPAVASQAVTNLPYAVGQTWEQKGYRCNVIRAHKNFLFALGLHEGTSYYPNKYRWSTPADNNGIPYTWDEVDLSAIAGSSSILGNAGPIVDGMTLRDSFLIYCTDSITILDYAGDANVWRARSLSQSIGLLAADCIADINSTHIFLSNNDIYVTDGNSLKSITNRRIKTKLKGLINSTHYKKSYCVVNEQNKEVWFCFPSANAIYPDTAIIYDLVNDKLSIRSIERPITSMCYGNTFISSPTWATASGTWETTQGNWNTDYSSVFSQDVIGIEPLAGGVYNFGATDETTTAYTNLERIGVVFGDQRTVTSITRLYPHMEGSSQVSIRAGSQEFVGGPVRWADAVLFNPSTDRKVDIRTTGKLHSWSIRAIDAKPFTYSGMDIEYVVNGAR
jgi:hypothetical protein